MKIKLKMNEFGLYKTEDGHWGIRQVGDGSWAVQHRTNADDPWDWVIISYEINFENGLQRIATFMKADEITFNIPKEA